MAGKERSKPSAASFCVVVAILTPLFRLLGYHILQLVVSLPDMLLDEDDDLFVQLCVGVRLHRPALCHRSADGCANGIFK